MVETAFGLVSFGLKRKALQAVKESQLVVVFDKQFELTKEQALDVLKREIKEPKIPVYAFILEGTNAIKEWLHIIDRLNTTKNYILYGQSSHKENQRNSIWLKSLERPSSIPVSKKKIATRVTTSEVTPIKKKVTSLPRNQITNDKKPTTTTQKKPLDPTKRVKRVLKKDEKSVTEVQKKKQQQQQQPEKENNKQEPKLEIANVLEPETTISTSTDNPGTKDETTTEEAAHTQDDIRPDQLKETSVETFITQEEEDACMIGTETVSVVSHPSTCSSATTDEHDAEVARLTTTTSKKYSIDSGRSFSPISRPETPEINQLRSKFEQLSQDEEKLTRKISKPPEFASRIKELKPRGPVGSRVRSMVELFMDENFNKWEF